MKRKILTLIVASIFVIALIQSLAALTISSVDSNPSEIAPGEKVSLNIEIQNNLNDDAEEVVVVLDLTQVPFSPYQSSNEQTIEEIKEDDEEKFKFELIADSDAKSGNYKIPVKISYKIGDEIKDSRGLVSLLVNAKPEISLSVDNSALIKGKENNLNIKIINSGLGEAKLLSIEILLVSGVKVTGADNIYIGNLDSDDFDVAEFKVFIQDDASSSPVILVKINYRDSANNQKTEDFNLPVKAYTQKEATELGLISKNNNLLYIGIVIAVVLVFIIYRKIRKRRRLAKINKGQ
ncbi:MAG: hypothetical protein KKA64_01440 [Nanoarchaeota archaeon]|nr:hypothetical protein [Nanoarchaeota archaeon]